MRLRSQGLNQLLKSLRFGSGAAYGDIERDWISGSISAYHENLTIRLENGASFYFACRPNSDSPNEYWETCKIEFNPAKIADSQQFDDFYKVLIANCKWIDFKKFDVAIDIPVDREKVMIFKDIRMKTSFEYSASNKTTYLGCRGNHGRVKLYNKQLESNLSEPMTRLEITMDYENSKFIEFKRVFPCVMVLGDLDELAGTDLVLCLACIEHDEYLRMLGKDKRKKIETLLQSASQVVEPSEVLYKDILSQILWFGNRIPAELPEFMELEDDTNSPF